jgi:predicted Fe-Mo cluster-binding NifX family protein
MNWHGPCYMDRRGATKKKGEALRIGVTVWNGRVSPLFDVSRHLALFKGSNREVQSREELALPDDPLAKVRALEERAVDVLICGAISGWVGETIGRSGIRLVSFVAGEAEQVLQAFLRGEVTDGRWTMPGCAGRNRRRRAGRRCRRGSFHPGS